MSDAEFPAALVEKVARNLYDRWRVRGCIQFETLDWDEIDTSDQGSWLDEAITALRTLRDAGALVPPGEYACEAEAERDELFNRLGRVTEELGLPVDATASRIIEAIDMRVDDEREACASVQVHVTVPDGAENWTPLEAWEEALVAADEAFRAAIRRREAAAPQPGDAP